MQDSLVAFWLEPIDSDPLYHKEKPTVTLLVNSYNETSAIVCVPAGTAAGTFFVRVSQNGVTNLKAELKVRVVRETPARHWSQCRQTGSYIRCGCLEPHDEGLLLNSTIQNSIRICADFSIDPPTELDCQLGFENGNKCIGMASFVEVER